MLAPVEQKAYGGLSLLPQHGIIQLSIKSKLWRKTGTVSAAVSRKLVIGDACHALEEKKKEKSLASIIIYAAYVW